MPKCLLELDNLRDSVSNLIIRDSPIAPSSDDEPPCSRLKLMYSKISGDENRILDAVPRSAETLEGRSRAKAGRKRPASRKAPIKGTLNARGGTHSWMDESIVGINFYNNSAPDGRDDVHLLGVGRPSF
jgi:hypothetical protein